MKQIKATESVIARACDADAVRGKQLRYYFWINKEGAVIWR